MVKILGLNPGASFGSAKRWDASYFAKVALNFSQSHDILIFGAGKAEQELCNEIYQILKEQNIKVKIFAIKPPSKPFVKISLFAIFSSQMTVDLCT